MKLRDYFWDYDINITEFADKIRFTPGYISSCVSGRTKPSKKFVRAVVEVTKGKVTSEEIITLKGTKKFEEH